MEVIDTGQIFQKALRSLTSAQPRGDNPQHFADSSSPKWSVRHISSICPESLQETHADAFAESNASLVAADATGLHSFPSNFPSEKRIPGTQFVVDGFRCAGSWSVAYFLSHFHSDHYTGLTPLWEKGLIFCSEITALLVVKSLKVAEAFVISLPLDTVVTVDGCEVTLVDANHCPGAVQFLFRVPAETGGYHRYVHTGDMRYCPSMKADSSLCDFVGADAVFLDTTYCNPKFVFPPQQESVDYVAETVFRLKQDVAMVASQASPEKVGEREDNSDSLGELKETQLPGPISHHAVEAIQGVGCLQWTELPGGQAEESHPRNEEAESGENDQKINSTLFLISTYVIGKEKILLAVAKRCNCLIYVTEKKLSLLKCLNMEDDEVFTTDAAVTNVRVVNWNFLGETWPFFRPNFVNMENIMREGGFTKVVGFVPTGWTYELKKNTFSVRRKGPCEIHLVPYSEHSNYDELREYVGFLRPQEIIPTVGLDGGDMEGKAVASMRKHFRNLVDETASKRNFLKVFKRKAPRASSQMTHGNYPNCLEHDGAQTKVIGQQETSVKPFINEVVFPATVDPHLCLTTTAVDDSGVLIFSNVSYEQSREIAPKAVFGKGARKRKKATDGDFEESLVRSQMPSVIDRGVQEGSEGTGLPSINNNLCDPSEMKLEDEPLNRYEVVEEQVNTIGIVALMRTERKIACTPFISLTQSEKLSQSNSFGGRGAPKKERKTPKKDNKSRAPLSRKGKYSQSVAFPFKKDNTRQSPRMQSFAQSPSTQSGTPVSRKERAVQSSILSFFRKPGKESTIVKKQHLDPGEEAFIDSSPAVCQETVQKPHCKMRLWDDEIYQLSTILDGNISEETAKSLLEQSGGDVGIALDLFNSGCFRVDCEETVSVAEDKSNGPAFSEIDIVEEVKDPELPTLSCKQEALSVKKETTSALKEGQAPEKQSVSVAIPAAEYNPIEHACWRSGDSAPYLHLARAFDLVEQEKGRLKTTNMLCNMFRSLLALSPEVVLPAVYLTTNRLAPDFEGVDLNIGGSVVSSAISEVSGVTRARLRELYNSLGDLGDVAQTCRQTQSILKLPPALSICQVFSTLQQISKESGSGSGARRKTLVLSLLRACREKEIKYIVRTLIQNMRIGAMMKTVLSALAQAVVLHHSFPVDQVPGQATNNLKQTFQLAAAAAVEAYNFCPNLDLLVPAMITHGMEGLSAAFRVSPGTPIMPMLAKITNGVHELMRQYAEKAFTCEYKYDGQRAQIHMLPDGVIRIFSRNCEDSTARFPDVIEIARSSARDDLKSFIIDTEVVAVDRNQGNKLMAFQHLSTRERGSRDALPITIENIKVEVCVFIFDLMYANGDVLVKVPLRERRERMNFWFPYCRPGYCEFASEITVETKDFQSDSPPVSQRVESFLEEAFAASCEGLMAKALDEDSSYMASERSDSWLKIKKDYIEGMHDTLDLVPIGAWFGNGRKAGWYSPFLLACYDPDNEEYQSLCRVMSGFTDAFYKDNKELYSGDHLLPKKPPYYRTGEEPDVWFTAEAVWEIRGADLTVSPVHQAAVGLIHPSRGISMRFPRFIQVRVDKKPENASTSREISDMFLRQTRKLDT